jgi:serine protease Do
MTLAIAIAGVALVGGERAEAEPPHALGPHSPELAESVSRMTPPVVNVSTRRPPGDGDRDLLGSVFGGRGGRGEMRRSLGSGVVIDPSGYVLTNDHVIGEAVEIRVTLADEREFSARVVGRDSRTDVALLKIDSVNLPTAQLGDSDAVRVGDPVVAVGNPFGLSQTVTAGIVSAKGRVIGAGPYDDFIQTDASINPGNSGGPLFDLRGRVVGINTAIVESARGIGFAIPANLIRAMLPSLRERGRVVRGFLGVSVQHVSPLLARAFSLPRTAGAIVTTVDGGGAAARSGVRTGDVIMSVDAHAVPSSDRLAEMIASHAPGSHVALGVVRGGRFLEIGAVIDALPDQEQGAEQERHPTAGHDPRRPQSTSTRGTLGVTVRPQTHGEAQASGVTGVVVEEVEPGGPAAGRVEVGDVIVEVDRKPAGTVDEFHALVRGARAAGIGAARPLLLRVLRSGGAQFVALERAG